MQSTPQAPNASSSPAPADPNIIATTIARLRAEHDATDNPTAQAVLLHEVGILEELNADEAAAARDQLGAVNADSQFREPLERLIAIIERRKSYKNLGKLLERLERVADDTEESARALVERAAFLADHQEDFAGAREALEQALDAHPSYGPGWLLLEIVAARLEDLDLRRRALARRAELTQGSVDWRALLLLQLAELELEAGNLDDAVGLVEQAIDTKGQATFLALEALERLGRQGGRRDLVARSLEAQASLILSSLDNAEAGTSLGVPLFQRTSEHAVDCWSRAALAHRQNGDLASAASLLDRALEKLPSDSGLLHARLLVAESSGDTEGAARIAQQELDKGVTGSSAASLWMRVAEAAAAQGNAAGAVEAAGKALEADPGCVPARVLQLDVLSGGGDPPALATALEAAAEQLATDEARARMYLAAADAWARVGRDIGGAKAALSQAGMFGAEPAVLARTTRMLATLTDEGSWYEEGTRRLLASGASESEQASLWFELGRSRLLRGDRKGARQAFEALVQAPGGGWVGPVLSAYVMGLAPAGEDDVGEATPGSALSALAEQEADPAAAKALKLALALRAQSEGQVQEAQAVLEALQEEDASDLLTAVALATLLLKRGDAVEQAREVLSACALATEEAQLAASLHLEAGIVAWANGARNLGVEAFSTARELSPAAAGALLGWALRAADPDSADARQRALEASLDSGAEPAPINLERFALEVSRADMAEALVALTAVPGHAAEVGPAADLARALVEADPDQLTAALERLSALGPAPRALAAASAYQTALDDGLGAEALEELAQRWVEAELARADNSERAEGAVAAALEWLGQSSAATNAASEIAARRALARALQGTQDGGEAAASIDASARVAALLEGDENQRLAPGRTAASQLVNLELALPGSDPRRRALALSNINDALGDDQSPSALALAGWNQLAAMEIDAATRTFRAVTEAYPEELIGWEGLRATAASCNDRATMAEACAALGDVVADDAQGADFWEQCALILIDELGDKERGEAALSRAIERDVSRFEAFDKLFRMVRARKDGARLLELIEQRLEVAEDPEEMTKLFWERARVLRKDGDLEGAMTALENVTMLEPDHVGALALTGEIALSTRRFDEAAENLARLASLDEAPAQQRLMSGVAAVDIFENKLDSINKALEVLVTLYRSGLSTLPVRERLARAAAKAESWEQAAEILEKLMVERDTPEGRVEAARLAMGIYRDRLQQPERGTQAVTRLLNESPSDAEGLDYLLAGWLPDNVSSPLLNRARQTVVEVVQSGPSSLDNVDRLARVAAAIGDAPLRQAALGAVVALGGGTPAIDHELEILDQRVARMPQIAIDENAMPDLCDPADHGPLPQLMRVLAPVFAAALGPGLQALGVTKREKVDPRAGLPIRNEIAAWAGALGLGDFDVYVGGREPHGVFAVATERPAVVVGAEVTSPLSVYHRQALARELFALRRGTTILRHRDPTDVAALVIATFKLAGIQVQAPQYAMLGEFERQLSRELPRKLKKVLPDYARPVVESRQDTMHWARAASSSLDRLAVIAAGDVSTVLSAVLGIPRGSRPPTQEGQHRSERLLAFVLSPAYLALRNQLGMGVR